MRLTGSLCTTTCHGTSSSSSPSVSFSLTGASTVDVDPFSSCTALTALMKNAITLSPQFKPLQLQEFCVERPAFFARSRHCDRRSRANGATRGLRTSATPARKRFRIVGRSSSALHADENLAVLEGDYVRWSRFIHELSMQRRD